MPENEYRIGDVVFISRGRWEKLPADGYFDGAPDIVIEILSPSNTAAEMLDKEQLCLENGAKEFWVVDLIHQHVKVSTSDGRTSTWKCRPADSVPLRRRHSGGRHLPLRKLNSTH